jgi:aldose 1-epimerase
MRPIPFGTLSTGEPVDAYLLSNTTGASMRVLTYGATIASLHVPDRSGKLADVVLGFSEIRDYEGPHPYMGVFVGRVAGRITGAKFRLDGKEFPLAANDGPNHLHGGRIGFDRRIWRVAETRQTKEISSIRLTYQSPDGEEGYPGNLEVSVTYSLTTDNVFIMETVATSDQPTPFSPTQHAYFNLRGEGEGDVLGHTVQVAADAYAPADERMTLLGQRELVGANDFRNPRLLRDALPGLHEAHGDLYYINGSTSDLRFAARVSEPESGRVLTVRTTEPCLQFYTGKFLDGTIKGKAGRVYGPHAGLCLECQGYPDGTDGSSMGDIVLRPGTTFRSLTHYQFSAESQP